MDRDEFERCWHDNVQQVTAYARRHVGRENALDVASATFLTAWRTRRRLPDPPLPWLLAVARGHVRNQVRSDRRQRGVQEKFAMLEECAASAPDAASTAEERTAALEALIGLAPADREALLLVAWDGLSTDQAADVLGCRPGTLRTRLSRARQRLELNLINAR